MKRKVIEIVNGVARHPLYRMVEPLNFALCEGEQLAIVGPNGSGKTMLVNTIIGRYPLLMNEVRYDFGEGCSRMVYENIHYIAFRDSYGDHDSNYYYQQRWHSQDVELSPTVSEQFGFSDSDVSDRAALFRDLAIDKLLTRQMVMLSSGELRRLQIAKALLTTPRVLIIDNPFIGLDAATRTQLRDLLWKLISERGLQLILVLSREDEVPEFITHVVPVYDKKVGQSLTLSDWRNQMAMPLAEAHSCEASAAGMLAAQEVIIHFRDVTLRYGAHTIFDHLSWEVRRGERWALKGRNGSGKSALLGLVCADNPQAYACDISLFGHRRGTGESIWDIKRRIGYVSPEMHRAYLKDLPSIEIVASGLHDSIGLYCRPRPEQMGVCLEWMRVFGIESLAQRTFLTLSSGEQRLVLLARAFVKDPELLILDEPLHGLDTLRREMVRRIIDDFCSNPTKTLIMVTHYPEELPMCITHYKEL